MTATINNPIETINRALANAKGQRADFQFRLDNCPRNALDSWMVRDTYGRAMFRFPNGEVVLAGINADLELVLLAEAMQKLRDAGLDPATARLFVSDYRDTARAGSSFFRDGAEILTVRDYLVSRIQEAERSIKTWESLGAK